MSPETHDISHGCRASGVALPATALPAARPLAHTAGVNQQPQQTVLVGAPGSGKSTVGEILAAATGRPHVDADAASAGFYGEVGWSVERLGARASEVGFSLAHEEWEVALAHAVERLVETSPGAVISLGAGHSHVTDDALFERVVRALGAADQVVLLRPSDDLQVSLEVLRQRCLDDKGTAWRVDGEDWLERWLTDGRDERVATHCVLTTGTTPDQTASVVAGLDMGARR
jgi:shikimate kinase